MSDKSNEPTQPIPIHEVEPAFAGHSLDINNLRSSLLRTAIVGVYFCALTLIMDRAPVEGVVQAQPAATDIQGPTTTAVVDADLPVLATESLVGVLDILGDQQSTNRVFVSLPTGIPKPADGRMDAGFDPEIHGQVFTYERHYHVHPDRLTDQTVDCLVGEIRFAESGDSINGLNHRFYDDDEATEGKGMSIYDAIGFESAAVALNIQKGIIDDMHDPIDVGDAVYVLSGCVMTIHSEQHDGTVAIFQKVIPNDELTLRGAEENGWVHLNPDIEE